MYYTDSQALMLTRLFRRGGLGQITCDHRTAESVSGLFQSDNVRRQAVVALDFR